MNLEEELELIESKIYTMYEKTIVAVEKAFDYYNSGNGYDSSVYIDDDEINGYEREIESLCMKILLREKVFSADLRTVCGAMKLVSDIERIADQAFDIKRISDEIKRGTSPAKIEGMDSLTSIVLSMVKSSLNALVKQDESQALGILQKDDLVDKLFWEEVQRLIMLGDSKQINSANAVYHTMVVKYLERIADHSTNIAEWTVYMISGYHKDKEII